MEIYFVRDDNDKVKVRFTSLGAFYRYLFEHCCDVSIDEQPCLYYSTDLSSDNEDVFEVSDCSSWFIGFLHIINN